MKKNQQETVDRMIGAKIIQTAEITNSISKLRPPTPLELKPMIQKHGFKTVLEDAYKGSTWISRIISKIIHNPVCGFLSTVFNSIIFRNNLIIGWLGFFVLFQLIYLTTLAINTQLPSLLLILACFVITLPLGLIVAVILSVKKS